MMVCNENIHVEVTYCADLLGSNDLRVGDEKEGAIGEARGPKVG